MVVGTAEVARAVRVLQSLERLLDALQVVLLLGLVLAGALALDSV